MPHNENSEFTDRPLLRGNVESISSITDYVELLIIEADPMFNLLIGHIRVDVNDATSLPYINVWVDGKQYIKDFLMLGTSFTADFNRRVLVYRTNKPILIQIKKTAAGTGTLLATCYVDGLEIPK